ncbi:hypothetical protein RB195_019999 [Necator americanus]|uniref:DUF4371 domain-containing protein n=1 Tax=Necator americanus TaxID=51031 RepID=A0ABR1CJJ2_NECAM
MELVITQNARNAFGGTPTNEELSKFPVVFMLIETLTTPGDKASLKRLTRDISYAETSSARAVRLCSEDTAKTLSRPQNWEVAFKNAVDVVVVSRNTSATNLNACLTHFKSVTLGQAWWESKWAMSISLCMPPTEDESYTKTFDEQSGYVSASVQIYHPLTEQQAQGGSAVRDLGFDEPIDVDDVRGEPAAGGAGPEGSVEGQAGETRGIAVGRRRGGTTEPPEDIGEEDKEAPIAASVEFSTFSYEEKNQMMEMLRFFYRQAFSSERQQHRKARENAKQAMVVYESTRRKNFIQNDLDLLLTSANFRTSKEQDNVRKLTNEKFQYFRPIFTGEWIHGKWMVKIRCERRYEALRGREQPESSMSAISQREVHQQAVAACDAKNNDRVNRYLDAVDRAPNDPNTAIGCLFFLAYTAAKMYLPPYQFPTLCQAVSKMGVAIGKKHRTRDGFVKMTMVDQQADEEEEACTVSVTESVSVFFADFLEALEITGAETGRNIFEAIYAHLVDVNLVNEYTWNLVAVATDGASNMIDERGLEGLLNANVSQSRRDTLLERDATPNELNAVPTKPVIWIHCVAHKIELVLSDAFAHTEEDFSAWRMFVTRYLNRLRVFFAAPRRQRVLSETGRTIAAGFLKLKRVIQIRWTSSEHGAFFIYRLSPLKMSTNGCSISEAILSFLRMYKHVWVALEGISQARDSFDIHERRKAIAFLSVLMSLKFYRYLSESTTIWKAQSDVDEVVSQLFEMAETPHKDKRTAGFLSSILCKRAIDFGEVWRMDDNTSPSCNRWFWVGWEYGGELAEHIHYKIRDEAHTLEFTHKVPQGVHMRRPLRELRGGAVSKAALLPAAVRLDIDKAKVRMKYFLPVLRTYMTDTAEVERGCSIYSVIREPQRNVTAVPHLSNYLRIAINDPDNLSPYEFLNFPMEWVAEGHQLSDQPGATSTWKEFSGTHSRGGEVPVYFQSRPVSCSALFFPF